MGGLSARGGGGTKTVEKKKKGRRRHQRADKANRLQQTCCLQLAVSLRSLRIHVCSVLLEIPT